MKKVIVWRIIVFFVLIPIIYLIYSYMPGMKIKLATSDRWEYHVHNIRLMFSYKLFVSSITSGIINYVLGLIIKRFTKGGDT